MNHDSDFAAKTRYGRPIASGTHTTALILGLTASFFSKTTKMVGLDYWVSFRRPIYANETIKLEWQVIRVTPNKKLKGNIVELRGRILGQDGKTSLGDNNLAVILTHLGQYEKAKHHIDSALKEKTNYSEV